MKWHKMKEPLYKKEIWGKIPRTMFPFAIAIIIFVIGTDWNSYLLGLIGYMIGMASAITHIKQAEK